DYQRSSPLYGQLIDQANHFNCLPSPCGRLSRPRTTTEAPPICTSSGTHSLGIHADLPQFTCWTQRMGEAACRSLYPCLPQVVANTTVSLRAPRRSLLISLLVQSAFVSLGHTCTQLP